MADKPIQENDYVAAIAHPLKGWCIGSVITRGGKLLHVIEQEDGTIFVGTRRTLTVLRSADEGWSTQEITGTIEGNARTHRLLISREK